MIKNGNLLIITSWSFEDGLIQAYTLPYLRIIKKYIHPNNKIILITLEKQNHISNLIEIEPGIWNKQLAYIPFSSKASIQWFFNIINLSVFIFKNKINIIHVWCTPSGMIGYILSIITGKKLIIDSFEPHAEAMVENGEWKRKSFSFKILFLFEKLQTHHAKYLIATTEGMKSYAREKYGFKGSNFFVKPACVDLEKFNINSIKNNTLIKKYDLENKIVGLYVGKFGGIYLEKEVFDFLKLAHDFWGNRFRILILTSEKEDKIKELAQSSNLDASIIISEFIKHQFIEEYIGLADFALTPVKPIPTKKYCTPIKNGEYWAMGLPIISTYNISDDSQIIQQNNIGSLIEPNNFDSYQKAIVNVNLLLAENSNQSLYYKIRKIAETYRSYDIAEKIYKRIYPLK